MYVYFANNFLPKELIDNVCPWAFSLGPGFPESLKIPRCVVPPGHILCTSTKFGHQAPCEGTVTKLYCTEFPNF